MHIVALTGSFYPNLMAPSACIKPYLLELAKGNEVEVVCPVSDPRFIDNEEVDGIHIHFVSNRFNDISVKVNSNIKESKNRISSKFMSLFVRGFRYLKEVAHPRPYDSSLENAYLQKLKTLNEASKIDVIISVTFPFYTHVFALKFKQQNPDLKWLTYTTDPLAYNEANPIPTWKKKSAIEIEKSVYNKCDYCLITEELRSNLVNDYYIPVQKIVVLPYLIETDNVPPISINKQNDRPQVLYAGCLFYRVRNPNLMLDVFSELKGIDLNLYVTGDRICRKMLKKPYPSQIKINGLVTRNEYFKLLGDADVLINLSNNAKLQAPHKLLELISTGRPIINFYYYKNSGYEIIEKYPLGLNISNNSSYDEMARSISDFVFKYRNKYLTDKEIKEHFPEYLLPYQMERINHLIII